MMRAYWLILIVLASATASAQVYRSVDADGNVTYSDRPQGENSETIFVSVQRPATATSLPQPPQQAQGPVTETTIEEAGELQQEPREPTPEERAEDRARNCAIARERAERYAISHRLYRETPDGERVYMDDAELAQMRQQSVADVQEWCD